MKSIQFKRLLVPFDFSECFLNSFMVAEEIAKKSGASITMLNVIDPLKASQPEYPADFTDSFGKHVSIFAERLEAIKNRLRQSSLPMERFVIRVDLGRYDKCIVDLNRNQPFDLIIVPDCYKTVLDRLLADINPLEIMEKTKTPVIAVNKAVKNFRLKKIVLPVRNVRNWFDKLPITVAIAKLTGAKIFVLGLSKSNSPRVIHKIEEKLSFCRQYLKLKYPNFEIEKIHINPDTDFEALQFSALEKADLMALSPPNRFFKLKSYFNKYFYDKVISKGNNPVLGVIST